MPGVKGRSGSPGIPKSPEHREAIRRGVKEFWDSPEGQACRTAVREASRRRRVARRREAMTGGGNGSSAEA